MGLFHYPVPRTLGPLRPREGVLLGRHRLGWLAWLVAAGHVDNLLAERKSQDGRLEDGWPAPLPRPEALQPS